MRFRYTMYVDESGNHHITEKALNDPSGRYLGVTGCIVEYGKRESDLRAAFAALRATHFPGFAPNDLDFQRSEIMNRRGPFAVLIDESRRRAFDSDLLAVLEKQKYRVVTVVIDKKAHVERYGSDAKEPYTYCVEVLLERFCLYVRNQNGLGHVFVEARNSTLDRELELAWRSFCENGTSEMPPALIQRTLSSKDIRFRPKTAMIDGLQLADMLGNPSKNDILIENGVMEDSGAPYAGQIRRVLRSKYDCNWRGEVNGCGKVFLK